MQHTPQLLLVGGPNGAGKSSFSKLLSEPGAVIFDVDKVIARIVAQTPAMPKKQVYQKSTQEFFNEASQAIKRKQHFTLETNFRDAGLADVVAEFKRYGYTTNMVYLTLAHIQQSIDRVNERVHNGGHYVDHKNIEQNYDLGLEHLEQFADRFDNLEILDASGANYELRSLLSIRNGVREYLSNLLPARVAETINTIASQFPPRSTEQDENQSLFRDFRR